MKPFLSSNQVLQTLRQRYATKTFDADKKISDADFDALLESLRLAPSSFGLQPWKFLAVKNPETRAKLREVSWGQTQVTEASHYVVLASRKDITPEYVREYIVSTAQIRGLATEDLQGYENMMVQNVARGKTAEEQEQWNKRQTYIALGFVGFAAAAMGIDTCMLEGFDPKAYDRILGLEGTDYESVVAVALGYRGEDKTADYKKSRFSTSEIIEII